MSNDANKLRQRQEIRKYLVFAGMFLLFVGCMWLIFAPSKEERQREERNAGFNSELPDPRGAGIEADKIAAYEQADMKRRQEEKMRTLEDFSALADENRQNETSSPVVEIPQERESESASSYRGSGNRRNGAISSSTSAYNDINATLGSFYEAPREDPEKEALKAEVEQLKQAAAVQQPAQMTYEEQVALLEKSYELAAKYTPGKDGAGTEKREETEPAANGRKARAVPVGQVSTPVVSSLPQPVSDSVLLARMAQTGYAGFHTAVGKTADGHTRNTIRACVHGDQTIRSGQSVRLRLLEPMRVGRYVLPRNSLVTGEGRIQGERLGIGIILLAPFLFQLKKLIFCRFFIYSLINASQIFQEFLLIFRTYIFDGITNLMYDTKLYGSIGINTLDGFRKTFQAVYTGYKNVFDSTVLKVCQNTEPEVCSLIS